MQVRRLIPSIYCPFCTDRRSTPTIHAQDSGPLSLDNLLSAGTITVTVHDGGPPCPSASSNRHWRHLSAARNSPALPADSLFRRLAFLIQHIFLRATYTIGPSGHIIFIRVYLVPDDLWNAPLRLHGRTNNVLSDARGHLHAIVPLIERNKGLWDADETCFDSPSEHLLPSHIDNRTMAEIYSDLPSPILDPPPPQNGNTSLSHRVASGSAIWGLRTTLYGYQRRSVAVMLQRESSTMPVPDPLYIAIPCMSGAYFYIQPSTMSVVRECPTFTPSRAGILCEELGSGKTVMIIALILATASQLASPEESPVGKQPLIMTPLAYRHFPLAEYAEARHRAGFRGGAPQQVPSLVEILVHYFSLSRSTVGRPTYTDELEASHLWPLIQANKAFYHHYNSDYKLKSAKGTRSADAPDLCPRIMYPSSSTLVVVPLNLLGQWKGEIDKHCRDGVRYLIVRPSTVLLNARKLASGYDVIVMSINRFRQEAAKNKMQKLHDLRPCTCAFLAQSRIPDCHCRGDPAVTPLLQVRWKRLVIDEGHVAGNRAATINYFVKQLSVQHKWIVTGTPTSNILGLELGRTTNEQEAHRDVGSDSPAFLPDLNSPRALARNDGLIARIWGNYDGENLRRLGSMIIDFLGVPRFCPIPSSCIIPEFNADDRAVFKAHVITPLRDPRGPRPGAINVLSQVMKMVMVRHRIEDVERDVLLPPMKYSVIYLDLNEYALKSYNAMQAGIAINAIDSERKDMDYLFHPSKAKELQTTINNSLQGLFWSSSDILYNVDQICELANGHYMRRALKRQVCPEDMELLQQALKHADNAANDKIWRELQRHPDIPFKISGLDPDVLAAWTRAGLCDNDRKFDIIHPDRLVLLRSLVRQKPSISKYDLIEEGNIIEMKERRTVTGSHDVKHVAKQIQNMAKDIQGSIETLKNHIEQMDADDDKEFESRQDRCRETVMTTACAQRPTFLSGVKVGPSSSTKLNYILSEVQRYAAMEKFLVFSNSLLTLYQIGDAMSLFEIKYLRYTSEEDYLLREQCVITFETSDMYRVLLIELKLGARGLNLISASRIIFCEPVWHPDVESQAIKRAHRIGQTRPVTVKTLVIRSTAEETMVARRQYLRSSDKIPSMTTESGMREYLMHPSFLCNSTPSSETPSSDSINAMLWLDGNQMEVDGISVDDGGTSQIEVEGAHTRKRWDADVPAPRKRVRFEEQPLE